MPKPVTPPPRTSGDSDSDVIDITPSPAPKNGHFPNRPRPKKTPHTPQSLKEEPRPVPRPAPSEENTRITAITYTGIHRLYLTDMRETNLIA